ncbi:MAG: OmpA family protein [Treponema sp.]|jgi:outer membrane protein OmpA-like peptidoglycan-associated protein|nr:OmpA family protein [Treponema sp.]
MIFGRKTAFFMAVFVFVVALAFPQTSESDESLYIVFSANSAELKGVGTDMAIRNSQTFTKVAQLLMENPQYRILVDGHANPVVGTSEEETGSLKPLSVRRAEIAADFLVTYYGVDRQRLILTGAGGGYPFGNTDPSLNRRVSFFIIMPK